MLSLYEFHCTLYIDWKVNFYFVSWIFLPSSLFCVKRKDFLLWKSSVSWQMIASFAVNHSECGTQVSLSIFQKNDVISTRPVFFSLAHSKSSMLLFRMMTRQMTIQNSRNKIQNKRQKSETNKVMWSNPFFNSFICSIFIASSDFVFV